MNNIGVRIKQRREDLGLTQGDLAKRLGYTSKSTIAKIEAGVNDISQKRVTDFADALSTSIAYLMGWKDDPADDNVKIPILGRVVAGYPNEAFEDVIGELEISEDMARRGEYFGLQIHGDSMSPNICDGDYIIVRKQQDAESGDTVVVAVNGDEATCKRLRKYKDGIELVPNNPSFKSLEYSKKEISSKPVTILGKVVELRRTF